MLTDGIRTLIIEDQLFERLDRTARTEGLDGVEQLVVKISKPEPDDDRRKAVGRIRNLRKRLQTRYGEMPDSTELIREDRAR